ncbi:hypothetical protein BH11GEM1_BH11GEM1_22090 [soil metagenome]
MLASVDRKAEIAALRQLLDRPGPTLALVTGRRRVGKTFMLTNTWPDEQTFYFVASEGTSTVNRRELLQAIARRFGLDLDPADYPTWRTVFRLIFELETPQPLVIVLDEFQFLMGKKEGVPSQLAAVFDVHRDRRPFVVVLCGSAVRTMEHLNAGDAPLYGRFSRVIKLDPFDYFDAAALMPWPSPRVCAIAYGAVGGTPRYLGALGATRTVEAAIADEVLAPSGDVRLQVDTLIDQERGLRNQHEYKAILRAIGAGRTVAYEIADWAGTEKGNSTKTMLEKLVDLGYVAAERNFAAKSNAPIRYRLADNALRFHDELVELYRPELARYPAMDVWRTHVATHLDTYMGRVFEGITEQAYYRHGQRLGLPMVDTWSRWQGAISHRKGAAVEPRSYEIDIVARLTDGRMMTGAVKWGNLGIGVHNKHLRELEVLADAGHAWAREALEPSAPLLYVTGGEFSENFSARASEEGHAVIVWTLRDLYEGALRLGGA